MEIKWTFADGTTSVVEVEDDIGNYILDSRRAEDSADRQHRRHFLSMDALLYEGEEYGADDEYLSEESSAYERSLLAAALNSLTDLQRRRLMLYAQGLSLKQIAEKEGTTVQGVFNSLQKARKNCKKILEEGV